MMTPAAALPSADEPAPPVEGNGEAVEPRSAATAFIKPVFAKNAELHRQFKAAEAAKRPTTTKKAAKTPKVTAADGPKRKTAQGVIHTAMPPPRVATHFSEGLQTAKTLKYAALQKQIRQARQAIKGPSEEEIQKGAKPPTPEQVAALNASIAQIEAVIEAEELNVNVIRLSANVGAALAAALDRIVMQLIDVYVTNTMAADRGVIDARWTNNKHEVPSKECGGISLDASAVGPFFGQLPVVVNYDQEKEDEHKAEESARKKEATAAKNAEKARRQTKVTELTTQITQNMLQMIAQFETALAAGQSTTTPNGQVVTPDQIPAQIAAIKQNIDQGVPATLAEQEVNKTKAKAARAKPDEENTRGYLTYIGQLCSDFKKIDPRFSKIRISDRLKHIIDEKVRNFIPAVAAAMRQTMKARTISGQDILNFLVSRQVFASRPQEEIDGLVQTVTLALERHEAHSAEEKMKKEARDQEKYAQLSEAERQALEAKKTLARQETLRKSIEAQQRRAEIARQTAAAKVAELQTLQNTGAPVAAAPAGAAPQLPGGMAGAYTVPQGWAPPQ